MIAAHEELESALASSTHDGHTHHEHELEAHGFLGHLLTHMPLLLTKVAVDMPARFAEVGISAPEVALHPRNSEPPFIPPRPSFLT